MSRIEYSAWSQVLIVLVMVGVLLKTRLLAAYHVMPLNKLLAGLGVVCGALGYIAIGKVGLLRDPLFSGSHCLIR